MGQFERDTAVEPDGELAFSCRIEPDWWVVAGPNGGYIAAILTRALASVEGERPLRSLTVQYLRAPKEGPARVEVTRERVGRSVSFLSARLVQDERPAALALAVPTLDLTVHLRAALPRPGDWVLGRFRTRAARAGFLEEDGELWSRDGELLAQSRQLALAL